MANISDHDLFVLIKHDNHMAFTELVNRYSDELFKHVCIKINNKEEAQDIIQEIFLSLWKNRQNIVCDENGRISSYLYKAAKYASINYYSRPGITITGANMLDLMLSFSSPSKTDEDVMYKELTSVVNAEVSGLPDRLKLPYRLSREQHMTIKEIAVSLSLSEQTVKNNISSALQRIKSRVGEYNGDSSIINVVLLLTLSYIN